MCEFINGHQARRSRYHGIRKTHVQHILTGIAINIERLASPRLASPRLASPHARLDPTTHAHPRPSTSTSTPAV